MLIYAYRMNIFNIDEIIVFNIINATTDLYIIRRSIHAEIILSVGKDPVLYFVGLDPSYSRTLIRATVTALKRSNLGKSRMYSVHSPRYVSFFVLSLSFYSGVLYQLCFYRILSDFFLPSFTMFPPLQVSLPLYNSMSYANHPNHILVPTEQIYYGKSTGHWVIMLIKLTKKVKVLLNDFTVGSHEGSASHFSVVGKL